MQLGQALSSRRALQHLNLAAAARRRPRRWFHWLQGRKVMHHFFFRNGLNPFRLGLLYYIYMYMYICIYNCIYIYIYIYIYIHINRILIGY